MIDMNEADILSERGGGQDVRRDNWEPEILRVRKCVTQRRSSEKHHGRPACVAG
jgi:hypothetical protein